jgi:hypothetical protein
MSYGAPENTAARNALTSGETSANGASASAKPTTAGCGSATTADSAAFIPKHREWIELERTRSGTGKPSSGSARNAKAARTGSRFRMSERGLTINHKYRLASDKRHRMDEGRR